MSHMHAEHKHILQTFLSFSRGLSDSYGNISQKKEKKKHNHNLFLVQKRDTKESSPDSLCF